LFLPNCTINKETTAIIVSKEVLSSSHLQCASVPQLVATQFSSSSDSHVSPTVSIRKLSSKKSADVVMFSLIGLGGAVDLVAKLDLVWLSSFKKSSTFSWGAFILSSSRLLASVIFFFVVQQWH